jgi:hypothetical protein
VPAPFAGSVGALAEQGTAAALAVAPAATVAVAFARRGTLGTAGP